MRSLRASDDPPPVLPAVGSIVRLTVPDTGRSWRCRVEELAGGRLLVTAPVATGGLAVRFGPGQAVALRWTTPTGLAHADGELAGREHDVVPCYWVAVRNVTRTQRRSAFRAAVRTPVALVVAGRRLDVETRDVSEVGLRVAVDGRATVEPDEAVRLRLTVDDHDLLAHGAVVWVAEEGDRTELGVRFIDLSADEADRLRRYVLALQFERRARTTRSTHE